jgi:uncharacterized protein (DUF302 family)
MTSTKSETGQGVITVHCEGPLAKAADRLEVALTRRGMRIYARVDQEKEAASAGARVRPAQLFLTGYPETNTPLLARNALLGLELPARILVWEDEGGGVAFSYPDPAELGRRYGLDIEAQSRLAAIRVSLDGIAAEAAAARAVAG